LAVYAQRFVSTPGKRDGLYWDTAAGEDPSPFGALVTEARAEGYGPGENSRGTRARSRSAHPITDTIQDPDAPGPARARREIRLRHQRAHDRRYALIAYPDAWGSSGIMTFMVSQQGRVYEKNLGADTAKLVEKITEYDPDPSWTLVKQQ